MAQIPLGLKSVPFSSHAFVPLAAELRWAVGSFDCWLYLQGKTKIRGLIVLSHLPNLSFARDDFLKVALPPLKITQITNSEDEHH